MSSGGCCALLFCFYFKSKAKKQKSKAKKQKSKIRKSGKESYINSQKKLKKTWRYDK